jgi:chromosome segregation ATPase
VSLNTGATHAADKENREREALRRVQQNAAKLQAEKSALEREKQELTAKVDAATKDLDGLKGEAARNKRRAATLDKEVEALRKENADLKLQLDTTGKNLAENTRQCQDAATLAQQNQKRVEVINANLKSMHAKEEGERKSCQATNLKLRAVAREILDRYENKGPFDSLRQAEPFARIKSVEIENLIQDYGDKIDALNAGKP